MGSKIGPSYASLFVGYIENQFFNQFNGTKPELYGRFNRFSRPSLVSKETVVKMNYFEQRFRKLKVTAIQMSELGIVREKETLVMTV